MKWTYDHNVVFIREILHQAPWLCKYGTTERGDVWKSIAESLNGMKNPTFKVSQRSVRDRYSNMERNHKIKVSEENRASGISPEETEVDQAMEEIIQLFEEHDRDNEKLSDEKKKKAEEDVAKAEEMRRQSLETYMETKKRKGNDEPPKKKKRASGSDTMNYLKERNEAEINMRAEELELRRQDIEKQTELQKEELKLKKQELEDKRKQNEAMYQQTLMQQQQIQLMMQQQQQQSALMIAMLEKALDKK